METNTTVHRQGEQINQYNVILLSNKIEQTMDIHKWMNLKDTSLSKMNPDAKMYMLHMKF